MAATNPFDKITVKKPNYSVFDMSYDHKMSFKMGYLVPTHVQEVIPGDKFKISSEGMFRMMPMIAPIMHKVDIYQHFFFVPNRIIWEGFEKFIGSEEIPDDVPLFPILNFQDNTPIFASSLSDYLGLPVGAQLNAAAGSGVPISALPFAAYYKIWYDYYRDQNLQDEEEVILTDGSQSVAQSNKLFQLRKRAWEHDYFTSALPWAQKGEAVTIPMAFADNPIPVRLDDRYFPGVPAPHFQDQAGNTPHGAIWSDGTNQPGSVDVGGQTVAYDPANTLTVDPDDFDGITTINDLRTAMALQKWLELNARAGTRYTELLKAHFNVESSDQRLQRPEYIGGFKNSMSISEVLQTSETSAETPQGNMAGHGIGLMGGKMISYRIEEHGYIMGILSVRPRTAYFQGVPRHFMKTEDRYQYYWPMFAFLGEQEIKNAELYLLNGDEDYNQGTFGYIPRYTEYRYNPSRVSGEMTKSLNFWHMARKFDGPPFLNESFIQANPTKRIFAVDDPAQDEIVAHIYHKIIAIRPMPKYGNPGSL